MATDTAGQRVLSPFNDLGRLGGVVDLPSQWRDGTVLRVRDGADSETDGANDWLFIKTGLSYSFRATGVGGNYILQVIASRRGYDVLNDDPRHDTKWVTIPARLALGEPFAIFRTPLVLGGVLVAEALEPINNIVDVQWACIDW